MLGENKPIIYLLKNKKRNYSDEIIEVINKIFIVINSDEDNWTDNLSNMLNRPYEELIKIWEDKQNYRDQFDEEWLMGMKLHAGKLGSKYIKKFINENI